MPSLHFHLLRPALVTDPYPIYRELREQEPVHYNALLGAWALSRAADVAAALHDPRLTAAPLALSQPDGLPPALVDELAPLRAVLDAELLHTDPPRHTRLRALVGRAFTGPLAAGLAPAIAAHIDQLLDAVAARPTFDLVTEVAEPLARFVVGELLLGLPPADCPLVLGWAEAVAALATASPRAPARPQLAAAAIRGLEALAGYLRPLAAVRRARPGPDLFSALTQVEVAGDRLSETELLATSLLLLHAGVSNTAQLISLAVRVLQQHPAAWEQLVRAPQLVGRAVEEVVRYDGPVQLAARQVGEELALGGRTLRCGQPVLLLLGAANRDPAACADPDRFDLARPPSRHLGFGSGSHACLGAPLARLAARLALTALLTRLPDVRLTAEAVAWQPTPLRRALRSLPLTTTTGS